MATACNTNQTCKVFIWSLVYKTCLLYETLSNITIVEDTLFIIGPRNCSIVEEVWPEFKTAFIRNETNTEARYFIINKSHTDLMYFGKKSIWLTDIWLTNNWLTMICPTKIWSTEIWAIQCSSVQLCSCHLVSFNILTKCLSAKWFQIKRLKTIIWCREKSCLIPSNSEG